MSTINAIDVNRVVQALRPRLGDRVLVADDDGFATARRVWNAAVTATPAVIARCRDAAEVGHAVRAARDAGLPVSVRAGGHDWAGRAIRDGGVVIDLTGMRAATVDGRTVTIEGGATARDLVAATGPHGLVTPTGVVGAVGMAGLTTVGGYGPLIGHCGLALDNLLGADVVLADGTTVQAGPDGDHELWWALRGGGGNFGVVTALRYQLYEIPVVLAGMLIFPLEEAAAVLRGYADIVAGAADELTVMTGFLPGPAGQPVVFICPFWCGADLGQGESAIAPLRSLGHPIVDQIGPMPYEAALGMFDQSIVEGTHYFLRSQWLPDLSGTAVGALVAGSTAVTSAYSALIVNRFHGAAARVDPGATAFAHRAPHQVIEIIAAWPPDDSADRHRAWAESLAAELAPVALPGGYPNLLGPDEDDRALASFGANLERLLAAKHRYDPDNVFASAIPGLR